MAVKLQTTRRGTYIVSIPKDYVVSQGWAKDQKLALCPCSDGGLRLMPLAIKGV